MRPLSVTLVEFNPSGGLFQFAVQLGEALALRGHDVELVTGPDPELTSRVAGLTIKSVLPTWHAAAGAGAPVVYRRARRLLRAGRYHWAWAVLLRHLARRRPDVVQFSGGRFPVDGIAPALLARCPHRPVLVSLAHAPIPFNEQRPSGAVFKRNPLLDRALGLGYRSLDAILVLGERTASDLRAAWPNVRRIHVVPHGDEGVFLRACPTGAADADPLVLAFGTMQAYKGLDLLLDAFAIVRVQCPQARLLIAGAPSGDTDLGRLRRRADATGGVEMRVGYVPLPEVAGLFNGARVVATPYRYANASGVVELAQTFARPVVATAVGDLPAVVRHDITGLVVPPDDASQFARALVRLLDDPQEAQRMGDAARLRSQEESSWPVVAHAVEGVYETCLRDRGLWSSDTSSAPT